MKKSVIIGCGNIGFATLCKLSDQGKDILVYDYKNVPPQYLEEYMREHGNVTYKTVNATIESSVTDAFSDLEENSVDFVLNTVGLQTTDTPFDNFDGYANVVDINVLGNIIPIKELVNRNIVSRGAKIVVIGSTSGHFVWKGMSPYVVSKWILVNVCSSLQHELQQKGIALKVVNPSTIRNQRSEIFGNSRGIDVNSVVSKVLSGGYQCFCPWYYGIFHFIERTSPWLFDRTFGLPLRFSRKKNYQGEYESILITGASSGLGKELAYRFAGICKRMYIAARNQDALMEIKQDLSGYKCDVFPLKLDLSDYNSVKEVTQELSKEKIDVIINNAGQHITGSVLATDVELYRRSIRINCLSQILLTAELLKTTKPRCIVNVLSTTAISGRTNLGIYSSPKAGLWAWTKVLRRNYGKSVNVIEVIPATFKSGLSNKGISTTSASDAQGRSLIQSGKLGLTSKDVSEKVCQGIQNHRDKILIPSFKVRVFILFEAIMPSTFRKLFS